MGPRPEVNDPHFWHGAWSALGLLRPGTPTRVWPWPGHLGARPHSRSSPEPGGCLGAQTTGIAWPPSPGPLRGDHCPEVRHPSTKPGCTLHHASRVSFWGLGGRRNRLASQAKQRARPLGMQCRTQGGVCPLQLDVRGLRVGPGRAAPRRPPPSTGGRACSLRGVTSASDGCQSIRITSEGAWRPAGSHLAGQVPE